MDTTTVFHDVLTADGIRPHLGELESRLTLQIYSCTDSTNLRARAAATEGCAEGLVVMAGSQTAGRGRLGRSFFSPDDTGLYMSLLLRPALEPDLAVYITSAAAVAVCNAIEEVCGRSAMIKWVNDIFLSGKKVCGILTEAAFDPQTSALDYVICGIGVNVYPPHDGFPAELSDIAGAVCRDAQEGLRNRLAAAILRHFFRYYRTLPNKDFLPEYRRRSMVIGRAVNILRNEQCTPAIATGIDDECRLLVHLENGEKSVISTGEISIRLQNI